MLSLLFYEVSQSLSTFDALIMAFISFTSILNIVSFFTGQQYVYLIIIK